MACCLAPPYRSLPLFRVGLRFYRHHVTPSSVQQTTYTMDQPRVASRWPLPRWQGPAPRSSLDRRRLMHHIEQLEIERLNAVQPFQVSVNVFRYGMLLAQVFQTDANHKTGRPC